MDDKKTRATTILRIGFESIVQVGKKEYNIVTEKAGTDKVAIVSKVIYKGRLVHTSRAVYGDKLDPMDAAKLELVVRTHHYELLDTVEAGNLKEDKGPKDYLSETKRLLAKKSNKRALALISEAYEIYPDDPFIVSYFGCLSAIVDKRFKSGVGAAKHAFDLLARKVPLGLDAGYKSVFYLNLCRAYLAAHDKENAVKTLLKGVKYDTEDGILHKELVKLGIRREPAVSFLGRSNPINKYIGQMLHKGGA